MNRRELLKKAAFLTSSLAVFGLPGCGSGGGGQLGEDEALSWPGVMGTTEFPQGVMAADPKPDSVILWTRVVLRGADPVAQVAAGSPDVPVTLELSSSVEFDTLLIPPVALMARAQYDNTIRHKLLGLQPGTTYFYRFSAGSGRSRIGRFRTAPAANADVPALNFAFIACQDWSVNHWIGLSALARQELDVLVHLGDYIYEAAGDSYQAEAVEAAHPPLHLPSQTPKPGNPTAKIAVTLEDYRYLYKQYRTDPRLQELHARAALIAIWDDHEFSDDCWQNNETYDNGSVTLVNGVLPVSNEQLGAPSTGTDTRQTQRRRNANRAWFEFMPADIPALDESVAGNFATVKIYRDLKFGKLAHFIMTDERLYRADHVIPEAVDNPATPAVDQLGSIGSRYFVPEPTFLQVQGGKQLVALGQAAQQAAAGGDLATAGYLQGIVVKLQADPTGSTLTAQEVATVSDTGLALVSVLGKTQRDWWKEKMLTSTSTWKFWGNEVSLLRMALNLNLLPSVVAQAASDPVLQAMLNTYLVNADQWDGYAAERAALTGFLAMNGIKNVVAVTGDIHAFYAGEVPANYGAYTPGSAALVDLVTAGVSSSSFWSYLASVVGSFEDEVKATKAARAANTTGYTNLLENGANPFTALRPLVYTSINMLIYAQTKSAVLATPGLDLSTAAGRAFAYRQVFEAYLAQEVNNAAGYDMKNTLNETFAGDMGKKIQELALGALHTTIPNPYTGTDAAPPVQNPWIKYVETRTQGYITVRVTPTQVVAKFHHTATLAAHPTPDNVVTSVKTVTVNKDSTLLTVS